MPVLFCRASIGCHGYGRNLPKHIWKTTCSSIHSRLELEVIASEQFTMVMVVNSASTVCCCYFLHRTLPHQLTTLSSCCPSYRDHLRSRLFHFHSQKVKGSYLFPYKVNPLLGTDECNGTSWVASKCLFASKTEVNRSNGILLRVFLAM